MPNIQKWKLWAGEWKEPNPKTKSSVVCGLGFSYSMLSARNQNKKLNSDYKPFLYL